MAMPSLPPEAHREPSGDTVTVLRYPVWPLSVRLSRRLRMDVTHTSLSQPADTTWGVSVLGE